jgi:hypothetical protein
MPLRTPFMALLLLLCTPMDEINGFQDIIYDS